jgi:cell division ATPase FtsA
MSDDPILDAHMKKKAQRQANLISTRLKHIANRVERELEDLRLPGEGRAVFGLFVFTGGAAQYIGNGEREDIKLVVSSVIKRWDDPEYATMHKAYHEKTDEEHEHERKDPL